MNSIKCPKCSLTSWAHEYACKRCGFSFGGPHSGPAANAQWSQAQVNFGTQPTALKAGLAIASMVLGIISIPTSLLLIGLLLSPVALVLGIVALVKASRKPMDYGGKGFAVAGIATGAMALFFVLPIIAAIAIPNILAAKQAANEGSAISGLRTIHSAQLAYMASRGVNSCADLPALGSAQLIDAATASGTRNGFRFEISSDCDMYATPLSMSDGARSFMITYNGVIRGAKKQGLKADRTDPAL